MKFIPDVRRGQAAIPAESLNAAFDEVERLGNLSVDPPLELERTAAGPVIRDTRLPSLWFRITGTIAPDSLGTEGGDTMVTEGGDELAFDGFTGESAYQAIQQLTLSADPWLEDLPTGVVCTTAYPLVEVTGNTDVPQDAIVRGFPSDNGDFYTFLYDNSAGIGDSVTLHEQTCVDGSIVTTTYTIHFPPGTRVVVS